MKFERLGNIVRIKKGRKPVISEKPTADSVRVLQIEDLRNDNELKFTDDKSGVFASKEDVLLAWDGANAGTIGYGKEGYIGSTIAMLEKINPERYSTKFLGYFLQTQSKLLREKSTGATIPHIDRGLLESLKIPDLPISDQIRIATLLSKAEALINQRRESIKLLDEYVKSIYAEMFGDPVKNQKGFWKGKIRDVVTDVKYGTSSPAQEDGENPYLRMNNITYDGFWDFSSLKYIDIDIDEKEKYLVRKGDLIFNRTNSKELVGKTAVFNADAEMIIAGYLIRVRLNEEMNPWYLWGYLNSSHGKQTLFAMCKSIVGMANINAQELQSIKILIPPVLLQNKFAEVVEKVESIKNQFRQSLKELENLFSSLSQQVFKGELDLTRLHSKATDEAIGQITKDSKQKKSTETKQKSSPEEDTRYGDPFEVDEATAQKQGDRFYKEWLRLHGKTTEQEVDSIWLQSKRNDLQPTSIKFNPFEGNAIISEVFARQNTGFSYKEFEAVLNNEKIAYTAKEVKDFIFQKLEQNELVQYYATKEWITAMRHPKFNPPGGPEFSGEGSIWFLVNKTEKAK